MSHTGMRTFTTDFKQGVVLRLEAGERLAAVADELKIKRKLLYDWRNAYRAMGVAGLNRKRGPKGIKHLKKRRQVRKHQPKKQHRKKQPLKRRRLKKLLRRKPLRRKQPAKKQQRLKKQQQRRPLPKSDGRD